MNKPVAWPKLRHPLVAILRGIRSQETEAVVAALIETGFEAIEIPLNSPEPFVSIEKAAKLAPAGVWIGAGTVLTADDVDWLHDAGGRLMVRHLLGFGHEKIGVVGAPGHSQPVQLRLAGIREELAKTGLEPLAVSLSGEHSFAETYRLARGLLQARPEVTALIGTTDIAAIACIHAAHDLGFSVPGDYSVIGFDDLPEAMFVLPRLTTVAQPIRGVGIAAADALAKMIAARESGAPPVAAETTRMPVALVARQSVGPARSV